MQKFEPETDSSLNGSKGFNARSVVQVCVLPSLAQEEKPGVHDGIFIMQYYIKFYQVLYGLCSERI